MKTKYTILEPVYMVKGKTTGYRLFIPVAFTNGYGLFSINLQQTKDLTQCPEGVWCFKFYRSKGKRKIKISKSISLFQGQLTTTENWKPVYVQCSLSKVKTIKEWIEHMNRLAQEKENV